MTTPQTIAIGYAATLAIAELVARWEASEQAEEIAKRQKKGDGRELNHYWIGLVRIVILVVGLGGMLLAFVLLGTPLWYLWPLGTLAFGWFAMRHRWRLNKRRDKSWWYLGPMLGHRKKGAAIYDYIWHGVAWIVEGGAVCDNSRYTSTLASTMKDGEPIYSPDLPGKLAYSFELAVAIASTAVIVFAP